LEEFRIDGSSVLAGASYDETKFLLSIAFLNGRSYIYYNVPPSIWKAFKESGSKGKFFVSMIKGRYAEGSR